VPECGLRAAATTPPAARARSRPSMHPLNYHHLLYFWEVARQHSVSRAARELNVSQPTVSAQIKALERAMGDDLFIRTGRELVLSEIGQTVFEYANEIFTLGRELSNAVSTRKSNRPMQLRVGISEHISKTMALRLVRPAMDIGGQSFHLLVRQQTHEGLLEALGAHELDVILTQRPAPSGSVFKDATFPLGESGVSFLASVELQKKLMYKCDFPEVLQEAPLYLPTEECSLRRSLDDWFAQQGIRVQVAGEFSDSATLKTFGQRGGAIFPVLTAVEREVVHQYRLRVIGRIDDVRERLFAIASSKRLTHPGVLAICRQPKILPGLISGVPATEIGVLKRIAKRLKAHQKKATPD